MLSVIIMFECGSIIQLVLTTSRSLFLCSHLEILDVCGEYKREKAIEAYIIL